MVVTPLRRWLPSLAAFLCVLTLPPKIGHAVDLNLDGYVDHQDLQRFVECFYSSESESPAYCTAADLNGNGEIDAFDFGMIFGAVGTNHADPTWATFESESTHLGRDETLYFHSPDANQIYRWSIPHDRPLAPIPLSPGSTQVAYSSSLDRLYVAYEDRRVVSIDATFPAQEGPFVTLSSELIALVAMDDAVFAAVRERSGASDSRHIVYSAEGTRTYQRWVRAEIDSFDWHGPSKALFQVDPDILEILAMSIDDSSGDLIGFFGTSYEKRYLVHGPIRVSVDGTTVFTGDGSTHDWETFTFAGRFENPEGQELDLLWLRNGDGVLLQSNEADAGGTSKETRVAHVGPTLRRFDRDRVLRGSLLGAFLTSRGPMVVTSVGGRPQFHVIQTYDDVDGDGVLNRDDAFPLDPAASVDEDGDGQPEAWNPSYAPGVPPTSLRIDVFPNEPACQFPEHGHPIRPQECDPGRLAPTQYTPTAVAIDESGMIYLLSAANQKIYRYFLPGGYHETAIEIDTGARGLAYTPAHDRVYVGYEGGRITSLVPSIPGEDENSLGESQHDFSEIPFASVSGFNTGLTPIGDFLIVTSFGRGGLSQVFDSSGIDPVETQRIESRSIAHSATSEKLFFQDSYKLASATFDSITGEIGRSQRDRAVSGNDHPFRAWPEGPRLSLASGTVVDTDTFEFAGRLPIRYYDARWQQDGSLVSIRETETGNTAIEWWDSDLNLRERRDIDGAPQALLEYESKLVVLTDAANPLVYHYTVSDDTDGDGVPNSLDDFPQDPRASVDTDRDGYPDVIHSGAENGLIVDAFPHDAVCHDSTHGVPEAPLRCDVSARTPPYLPTQIVQGPDNVIYLLSREERLIFRWSLETLEPLGPIRIGKEGIHLSYSAEHDALYVAYLSGQIERISGGLPTSQREAFARVDGYPNHLLAIEDRVIVYASRTRVFDAQGRQIGLGNVGTPSPAAQPIWSPELGRLYQIRANSSPNDLESIEIDLATGETGRPVDSPYHGDFKIGSQLRLSPDGRQIFGTGGNLWDGETLTVTGSIGKEVREATWKSNGGLVTSRDAGRLPNLGSTSIIEYWTSDLEPGSQLPWPGAVLRIFETTQGTEAIVAIDNSKNVTVGHVESVRDGDGDGVDYDSDAFPLDPAASLDSDRDGAPDEWNPGYSAADSRLGLTLDAFPRDSACQIPKHARADAPNECDIESRVGSSLRLPPMSAVVDVNGVVYLRGRSEPRLERWSLPESRFLNPVHLAGYPSQFVYSPDAHRLYTVETFGGTITSIDPTRLPLQEEWFASLPGRISGLLPVGSHLYAEYGRNSRGRAVLYPRNGGPVFATPFLNHYFALWNSADDRIYRLASSRGLGARFVDPEQATIGETETLPLSGSVGFPLRFGRDNTRLVSGTGDVFEWPSGVVLGSLPGRVTDAAWIDSGLITIEQDSGIISQWGDDLRLYDQVTLPDEAIQLITWSGRIFVLSRAGELPAIIEYFPTTDSDGDGTPNEADAFPRDPSASTDRDNDGAPDAWTAGRGPKDSTLGLVLDAWPDDFACQLEEHGYAGQCDFDPILPASRGEPICNVDFTESFVASGVTIHPAAVDLEPLCAGWALFAHEDPNTLSVRNVLDSRLGKTFPLPGAPRTIVLDSERGQAFIAMERDSHQFVRVDLATGSVSQFDVPDDSYNFGIGPGGDFYFTTFGSMLYRIPFKGEDVEGGWEIQNRQFTIHETSGDLYLFSDSRQDDLRGTRISRNRIDPIEGATQIEATFIPGVRPHGINISPDGENLLLTGEHIEAGSRLVFELDPLDIGTVFRERTTPADTISAVMSPNGELLLTASRFNVSLLDFDSGDLIFEFDPPDECRYGSHFPYGFSTDGRLAFALQTCPYPTYDARVIWYSTD